MVTFISLPKQLVYIYSIQNEIKLKEILIIKMEIIRELYNNKNIKLVMSNMYILI